MRKREDLTKEVREAVVRDYLRGDKTIILQMEYKISPGEIYRILHRHQVKLRSDLKPEKLAQRTGKPIKQVMEEVLAPVSRIAPTPVALLDLPFAMRVRELAYRADGMTCQETLDQSVRHYSYPFPARCHLHRGASVERRCGDISP